ncbi:hypothetical protein HK102_000329 [Quaeritorhiza haematococci]|nr:hypothetical protein HK102_000329 [Quaeritorhiza haematococci]
MACVNYQGWERCCVFLEIIAPIIITTTRKCFYLTITGGHGIYKSHAALHEFTHDNPSYGWTPVVECDQWAPFRFSYLEVKICLRYTISTSDSTRELYSSFVNNENGSDCSFLVEEKRDYALSLILRHRSAYFKAMLESQFAEGSFSKDRPIELPNLKYAAVLCCMNWMYTGRGSDMFGLEDLAQRAVDVIISTIALKTFGEIYVFARTFKQPQLASKVIAFWKRKWAKTQREGTKANKQAKIIMERMGGSGDFEEELWAFAAWALGDGSGGSK